MMDFWHIVTIAAAVAVVIFVGVWGMITLSDIFFGKDDE